ARHAIVTTLDHWSNRGRCTMADAADKPVQIAIGAEVTGVGGKLGEVSRVIVENGEMAAIVVKHGGLGAVEYVVPLTDVDADAQGNLGVPLTEDQLKECELFDFTAYRMPDEDYVPPAGLASGAFATYAGPGYIALGPRMFTASGQPVPDAGWEP